MKTCKSLNYIIVLMSMLISCSDSPSSSSGLKGNIAKTDHNGSISRLTFGIEDGEAVLYLCSNKSTVRYIPLSKCEDKVLFPGVKPIPYDDYLENLKKNLGLDESVEDVEVELKDTEAALDELIAQQIDENAFASDLDDETATQRGSFQTLITNLENRKHDLQKSLPLFKRANSLYRKIEKAFQEDSRDTIFVSSRYLSDEKYFRSGWDYNSTLPPMTRVFSNFLTDLKEGLYKPHGGYSHTSHMSYGYNNNSYFPMIIEKVDAGVVAVRFIHQMGDKSIPVSYYYCKDRSCRLIEGDVDRSSSRLNFDSESNISFAFEEPFTRFEFDSAINLTKDAEKEIAFRWGDRYYNGAHAQCGISIDPTRDRQGRLVSVILTPQHNGHCPQLVIKTTELSCLESKFVCHTSSLSISFLDGRSFMLTRYGTDGILTDQYQIQ